MPAHNRRPVGSPAWRDPQPLEPHRVLPQFVDSIDLILSGDGGLVVYLTVPEEPSWAALRDIALAAAAVVLSGSSRQPAAGSVQTSGNPPCVSVLEVRLAADGRSADLVVAGLASAAVMRIAGVRPV